MNYKLIVTGSQELTWGERFCRVDKQLAFINYDGGYIGLGGDLQHQQDTLTSGRTVPYYSRFETIEELYESEIENLLNHEYIHGELIKISREATDALDNIDESHEISGFMIVDIELRLGETKK